MIRGAWDTASGRCGSRASTTGSPACTRTGAAARRRDLDRRDRAEDARADRPGRRRLAAQPVLRPARHPRRAQRPDRRRRRRRGPRPGRRTPALQRQPVRRPGVGRVARRPDAHPRDEHLHRHRGRPGRHPAVRHRGRAGGAGAGRRRAVRCAGSRRPGAGTGPSRWAAARRGRRPTTAYAAAARRRGTSPPARRTTHPIRRSPGPRTSARPVSISSTCTTTCAPSWPSCST